MSCAFEFALILFSSQCAKLHSQVERILAHRDGLWHCEERISPPANSAGTTTHRSPRLAAFEVASTSPRLPSFNMTVTLILLSVTYRSFVWAVSFLVCT